MAQEVQTVAGVGSLVSEASARESFDFGRFRVGQAPPAVQYTNTEDKRYIIYTKLYTNTIYTNILQRNIFIIMTPNSIVDLIAYDHVMPFKSSPGGAWLSALLLPGQLGHPGAARL